MMKGERWKRENTGQERVRASVFISPHKVSIQEGVCSCRCREGLATEENQEVAKSGEREDGKGSVSKILICDLKNP